MSQRTETSLTVEAPHRSTPPHADHFTVDERVARGKAARGEVPRSVHAAWEPSPHRPSPVELLEEQAQTRVPELVPIRYGRMLVSPFTFYRGAAYLMASDLSGLPRTGFAGAAVRRCASVELRRLRRAGPAGRVQHQRLRRDAPGPFEWDVKRLVASFAVAGRDRGFDDKQREAVNLAVGRAYREAMAALLRRWATSTSGTRAST